MHYINVQTHKFNIVKTTAQFTEYFGKDIAKTGEYDFFTTTLSISPLKNAQKLNEIGMLLAEEYGTEYLLSDFKKKNGYKRSVELSEQYGLYRQDYCGCVFSMKERKEAENKNKK